MVVPRQVTFHARDFSVPLLVQGSNGSFDILLAVSGVRNGASVSQRWPVAFAAHDSRQGSLDRGAAERGR